MSVLLPPKKHPRFRYPTELSARATHATFGVQDQEEDGVEDEEDDGVEDEEYDDVEDEEYDDVEDEQEDGMEDEEESAVEGEESMSAQKVTLKMQGVTDLQAPPLPNEVPHGVLIATAVSVDKVVNGVAISSPAEVATQPGATWYTRVTVKLGVQASLAAGHEPARTHLPSRKRKAPEHFNVAEEEAVHKALKESRKASKESHKTFENNARVRVTFHEGSFEGFVLRQNESLYTVLFDDGDCYEDILASEMTRIPEKANKRRKYSAANVVRQSKAPEYVEKANGASSSTDSTFHEKECFLHGCTERLVCCKGCGIVSCTTCLEMWWRKQSNLKSANDKASSCRRRCYACTKEYTGRPSLVENCKVYDEGMTALYETWPR